LINISHEGLNQTFRHLFEFFHYQVYTSHKISDAIDILETEKNVYFLSFFLSFYSKLN